MRPCDSCRTGLIHRGLGLRVVDLALASQGLVGNEGLNCTYTKGLAHTLSENYVKSSMKVIPGIYAPILHKCFQILSFPAPLCSERLIV